jgi:hypothetical protein
MGYLGIKYLYSIVCRVWRLQNIHNKWVVAKILVLLGLGGSIFLWGVAFLCVVRDGVFVSLRGEFVVGKCEGLPWLSPQAALF